MPLNWYFDWRSEQKHLLKQQRNLTLAALKRMDEIYQLLGANHLVRILERLEDIMAVNEQVLAYAKRIDEATNNIAADIQRILDNPASGLSEEDRATLEQSVGSLEALAAVRPEEPPVV